MKRLILVCTFVFLCSVACNSSMRDGAKTGGLKAGMPDTLTLPSGEVVYDLNGRWDIVTRVSNSVTYRGVIDMKQEGNQFVGTLESGDFPVLETSQKIKGKLKGNEIEEIQFNSMFGWINNCGGILEGGKELTIITPLVSENLDVVSTLKKR